MNASQEPVEREIKEKPVPLSRLPRLFVSRRWWWASLLVIAGMVITFRLGIWQVNRLQQRRERNAEYIEQIKASPVVLSGDGLPADVDELRDRPAVSVGHFDFGEQIILVQQNYEGRPGVHLIAPFVINGSDQAILVDRGWIPAHELEEGELSRFTDPDQDRVAGSLQPSQTLSGGRVTEVDGKQEEWYRIDIDAIQEQMPYALLSAYLMEAPVAEIQEQLPYRVVPDIDLSEGPHLGYAIQWFLFCLMLAVGYAYFVRTRS